MEDHRVLWDLDCYSEEFVETMDDEESELAGFMKGYMDY